MIQPILLQYFEIINYLDEFVAIIMLLFYIKSLMHAKKIEKIEFKIITIMILIFGIGIMGNIINKYQLNRLPILWDAFNVFKVFFTLLGSMHFINQNCDKKKIISFLASYIRLIIFCGIMCWFITLFKDIGMNVSEVRYGIKSYNFIFINAGLFAMYLNLYLFILTIDLKNKLLEDVEVSHDSIFNKFNRLDYELSKKSQHEHIANYIIDMVLIS